MSMNILKIMREINPFYKGDTHGSWDSLCCGLDGICNPVCHSFPRCFRGKQKGKEAGQEKLTCLLRLGEVNDHLETEASLRLQRQTKRCLFLK